MSEVSYRVVDNVALITLDALERRNALTLEMVDELVAAVDQADSDRGVGAIVVSGQSAFCAGAQLSFLEKAAGDPSDDENFRAIESVYRAFLRIGSAVAPTVAAVRGAAVGAGMNLMLATDLRIVATDARLISGFGRLGVHPGGGHFLLLERLAGREVASAMGLFGQELDGARAVELGLAWESVPDADVDARALEIARLVARDPELARRMTASFRRETARPGVAWDVAVEVERSPQMWSFRRKHSGRASSFRKPS